MESIKLLQKTVEITHASDCDTAAVPMSGDLAKAQTGEDSKTEKQSFMQHGWISRSEAWHCTVIR